MGDFTTSGAAQTGQGRPGSSPQHSAPVRLAAAPCFPRPLPGTASGRMRAWVAGRSWGVPSPEGASHLLLTQRDKSPSEGPRGHRPLHPPFFFPLSSLLREMPLLSPMPATSLPASSSSSNPSSPHSLSRSAAGSLPWRRQGSSGARPTPAPALTWALPQQSPRCGPGRAWGCAAGRSLSGKGGGQILLKLKCPPPPALWVRSQQFTQSRQSKFTCSVKKKIKEKNKKKQA